MKTYYVKTRGNIYMGKMGLNYCDNDNYSIWKVKVRFYKTKSPWIQVVIHDTNIEYCNLPHVIRGKMVISDSELNDLMYQDQVDFY